MQQLEELVERLTRENTELMTMLAVYEYPPGAKEAVEELVQDSLFGGMQGSMDTTRTATNIAKPSRSPM